MIMKLISSIKKAFDNGGYTHRPAFGRPKSRLLALGTCLLALTLAGCSDDLDVRDGINDYVPDGYVQINFTIPESEHIITRADNDSQGERNINNLTILVFDSEGEQILQREDVDLDKITTPDFNQQANISNSFTYTFESNKIDANSQVYVIANAKVGETASEEDLIAGFTVDSSNGIDELEEIKYSTFYDDKESNPGYFMSGIGKYDTSRKQISIVLTRSAGKLTLKDERNKNDEGYLNFKLTGFTAHNIADECFLTAGSKSEDNNIVYNDKGDKGVRTADPVTDTDESVRYDVAVNPTKTHTVEDLEHVTTLIAIKGTYNGKDTYYAIPIYDRVGKKFYDILPNHWYEMQIKDVKGPGYDTEEKALDNPFLGEDNIVVDIHDHASQVLSMVSDGIRELGVTASLNFETQKEFTVKLYSKNEGEVTEDTKPTSVTITSGSDWIKLVDATNNAPNPTLVNVTDETSGQHPGDEDNPGVRWKYKLEFIDQNNVFSDKTATILVQWGNLVREIKVTYNADFRASDFCFATLNILNQEFIEEKELNYADYYAQIDNYWEFVSGQGEASTMQYTEGDPEASPVLDGIPRLFGTTNLT